MAHIVDRLDMPSSYKDNKNRVRRTLMYHREMHLNLLRHPQVSREDERNQLANSTTLYVGNLSFYTTEAQIYESELGLLVVYHSGLARLI
jgi:nuclear cap-binding protein subunit 2